ncbi:MAG: restriction endonuclease subunit S [PVC group bacterium]
MNNQHDSFLDSLPHGWTFDRLKDVAALRNDKTDEASADEDYLELEDLESGTGRILNRRNTLEVESAVTLFKKGDVLFGKLRPYLEKYYEAEFNGKCTGEILAFKPERISSRFLFYCVGSRWFIELCNALAYGAKMPRVSWPTQLSQFNIPLPPQPEQQRIAAYLDASCAAIDAAVAAKSRQLETLDDLRKTIIAQAVTKGLNPTVAMQRTGVDWFGQIPKNWRCEHLKRFATRIQTGCTPPTNTPDYYFDGTISWFAPGSYDGDIELRKPRKLINELGRRDGVLRMFPANTVFLVGIGATIGKVGLIRQEAACNQQIIGIVSNHRMLGRYLAYQFKIYEDVIHSIASATTLPIFDQVKTGYLPTLQPPRFEQGAICAFLDAKLAEVKRIVAGIETQISTLTAYRKSLIHECVTGQRRVTEADVRRAGSDCSCIL